MEYGARDYCWDIGQWIKAQMFWLPYPFPGLKCLIDLHLRA